MKRLSIVAAVVTAVAARAQQPMGTVATHDAAISGSMDVHAERATLLSNDRITAFDHTATIALTRGGEALVCATSEFHLLHSGAGPALLFGLDRGALQISSLAQPQDVVVTPDIRFTVATPGTFDLRLRVTREGDTCVENRGAHAPVLLLNNAFGNATYRVLPGQHVLFEHGDLHQVVDHERTSCGCPDEAGTPLGPNATPAQIAAAAHPFPAGASQGLGTAPEPALPTQPVATASTDFRVNGGDVAPIALSSTQADADGNPSRTQAQRHGFFHAIGSFFRRLFGDDPKDASRQ